MFIFTDVQKKGAPKAPKEIVVPHLENITADIAYTTYYGGIQIDAKNLQDLLKNFEGVKVKEDSPFAVLKNDKAEPYIHIFPNFKWRYTEAAFEVSYDAFKETMKPLLLETVKAVYNEKIEAFTWRNKASSIALKTQDISFEQFLVRYTNSTSFLKDSEIRDMAHKIKCGLIMYDLMVCDTPQDYYEMFNVPTGSCMQRPKKSRGVQGYSTDTWDIAHEKYGLHPGSWYHWTGTSKGCYLVNKLTRAPVARAMLYSNKDGGWTMYGDVKYSYSHGATLQNMIKALENHGFVDSWPGTWPLSKEFRVPGFDLDGTLKCPYPFGDNVKWRFDIDFDDKTNEFIFSPSHNEAPYRYNYGGFISRENVLEYRKQHKKAA